MNTINLTTFKLKRSFALDVILFFFLLFFSPVFLYSQQTSINEAQIVALKIISEKLKGQNQKAEISSILELGDAGNVDIYAISFSGNNGFILISGDKRMKPVLGYSDHGNYSTDEQPEGFQDLIQIYKSQISKFKKDFSASKHIIHKDWDKYLTSSPFFDNKTVKSSVAPLIFTTWNQNAGWNGYCPYDPSGGPGNRAYAGCGPVAIGQIMKYYHHPSNGINIHSYTEPAGGVCSSYGTLTVNFSSQNYNWGNMLATQSSLETAKLLYHIGVGASADYCRTETNSSLDNLAEALVSHFKYSPAIQLVWHSSYTDSAWIALMKNEIDNSRPIAYSGFNASSGHLFVLDGYDNSDMFHCNWGWSGSFDGYYSLDSLCPGSNSFNLNQIALINIIPISAQAPVTDFYALNTTIYNSQNALFFDQSTDIPTSWSWSFPGGTPSSSTEQNPVIRYDNPGVYTVSLTTSNSFGSGVTKTKTNYINVNYTPFIYLEDFTQLQMSDLEFVDYDNDNDLDIFAAGADFDSIPHTGLWRNDGNGHFTEQTSMSFTGVHFGSLASGDIDNDGDMDLLICGDSIFYSTPVEAVTKIYRNNYPLNSFTDMLDTILIKVSGGDAKFHDYNMDGTLDLIIGGRTSTGTSLVKLYSNDGNGNFTIQNSSNINSYGYGMSAAWYDYNEDGLPDVAISGGGITSKLFINKNNGDGTFTDNNTYLSGTFNGDLEWADYNNDGKIDIIENGLEGSTNNPLTKLYYSTGNTFSQYTSSTLQNLKYSSVAFGDFTNDGFSDLIMTGQYNTSTLYTKLYKNNNGVFSEITTTPVPNCYYGTGKLADINNDGAIDLVLLGNINFQYSGKVFLNINPGTNTPPQKPVNLNAQVINNNVTFSWDAGADDHTTSATMTYNLVVGTSKGDDDLLAAQVDYTTGFLKNARMGNVFNTDTGITIRNLPQGWYYWQVQCVDQCFKGSTFASDSFFVSSPIIQASNVNVRIIDLNSAQINWTRGSGEFSAVFVKVEHSGQASPQNTFNYDDDNCFGSGDSIQGTEWYCIYHGTDTNCIINCLHPGWPYRVEIVTYDNFGSLPFYNNSVAGNISDFYSRSVFDIDTTYNLPHGSYNVPHIGVFLDMDRDRDLDLTYEGGKNGVIRVSPLLKNEYPSDSFSTQYIYDGLIGTSTAGRPIITDINNDNYPDISLGCGINDILINNKDFTFTRYSPLGSPIGNATPVSADIDMDGDMDIVMTGQNSSVSNTFSYFLNDGTGSLLLQSSVPNMGTRFGSIASADFDNDYDPDFFVSGYESGDFYTQLIINDGEGNFTLSPQSFATSPDQIISEFSSKVQWGDYDADGNQDLMYCGYNKISSAYIFTLYVYHNEGNGQFTLAFQQDNPNMVLPSFYNNKALSFGWGDYDTDGDLDLLSCGNDHYFLKNDLTTGTFVPDTEIFVKPIFDLIPSYGDFDNDGDIDMINYDCNNSFVPVIMKNYSLNHNNPPSAPTNLFSDVRCDSVYLNWSPATDDLTPSEGLTYNLYVYNITENKYIVSPLADTITGDRYAVNFGNRWSKTGALLRNLPYGSYLWKVQAIDNSFKGGPFSAEGNFNIDISTPTIQAIVNQQPDTMSAHTATISWTPGNGYGRVVFMKKEDHLSSLTPVNGVNYHADSVFMQGDILPSNWYCVYNGTGNSVTVTGLESNSNYIVKVFEYNSLLSCPKYNPGFSYFTFLQYDEFQIINNFDSIPMQGLCLADYNNDGLMDFAASGPANYSLPIFQIYLNQGNHQYTRVMESPSSTTYLGSADIDNDGDIDLFIAGEFRQSPTTILIEPKFYLNNGDGTFNDTTSLGLDVYSYMAKGDWGDFDNDGDLDIAVLTADAYGTDFYTKIFQNNYPSLSFTPINSIALQPVTGYSGEIKWVDYDNDRDLDLIYSGVGSTASTVMYTNQFPSLSFTPFNGISVPGFLTNITNWRDYDEDGDLDLFAHGQEYQGSSQYFGKLFRNNFPAPNFTEDNFTLPTSFDYSKIKLAHWGDFNQDGKVDLLLGTHDSSGLSVLTNNGPGVPFDILNQVSCYLYNFDCADMDNDGDIDVHQRVFYHMNCLEEINIKPDPPTEINTQITGNSAILSWSYGADDLTPPELLSYNVFVGNAPNQMNIITAESNLFTGFRLKPEIGNCVSDTFIVLNNLIDGNYYWGVQSIDNSLLGSTFNASGYFSIETTGLQNNASDNTFMLFPNPVNDILTIVNQNDNNFNIEIKNITGKTLISKKCNERITNLSLKGILNAGVYFVTYESEGLSTVKKIIVY